MTVATAATVPEAVLEAIGALEAAERLLEDLGAGDKVTGVFLNVVCDAMLAVYGPQPDDEDGLPDWDARHDAWTHDTYSRAKRILKQIDEREGGAP